MSSDSTDSDDVTSVLLLAPDVRDAARAACLDRLATEGAPLDHLVGVTVTASAADWLDTVARTDGLGAASVTCVDVAGGTRSAAARDAGATAASDGSGLDATVERVRDPTALEQAGRLVSDVLQRAADADQRVGVAVHSLTDVLQYVDEATAFKFAYTLGEVVRRVDGVVYFHLDPAAHDEETVQTFSVVCDRVTELDTEVAVRESCERE